MRIPVLLALVAIAGCKKDKGNDKPPGPAPVAPTSTDAQDALWALAPEGALVGFVVSPTGLERLEAGANDVNKVFTSAPDLAPFKAKIDEGLTEILGSPSLSLSAAGMSSKKGLAVFVVPDQPPIIILPVTDRDKFLAVAKGQKGNDVDTIKKATCKTIKDVYACARTPELFDKLGKGSLKEQLKLAGARGDVEAAATIPGPNIKVGAVVQLSRGTAVMRAGATNLPPEIKLFLANTKPRTDGDKTAGFAVVNIAPILMQVAAKMPSEMIVSGVRSDELVKSIAGPLTLTMDNTANVFDLQLPLNDPGPAQKILDQCDKLPPAAFLGLTVKDGVCHAPIPQMQMEVDAWIDGKTFHIGKKGDQTKYPSAPMSAVGQELANGEWTVALFGRGTMFAPIPFPMPMPPTSLPPEAMLGFRSLAMVNEVGYGVRVDGDVVRALSVVRTAWANPDDVVAKIVAIQPMDIVAGKASTQAKTIADASPKSPFAADFASGYGGLMIPAAMVGMLAAVAIPAFLDYNKKARRPEALLQLNKLSKNAKVAFITNAAFPKGKVGPTPAKSCCESGGKCMSDPKDWSDPVWQSLDFMIDEPHLFRYSYESDGKTFVAKATGDLDCDGVEVEYRMEGKVDAGNPVIDIVEPPPNAD
jgi:hypothetical protein